MKIFMVYFEGGTPETGGLTQELNACVLRDGLWLVAWDDSRSRLYHDVKHTLKSDAALLTVELDQPPKFKGMADGSLAWVREHFENT